MSAIAAPARIADPSTAERLPPDIVADGAIKDRVDCRALRLLRLFAEMQARHARVPDVAAKDRPAAARRKLQDFLLGAARANARHRMPRRPVIQDPQLEFGGARAEDAPRDPEAFDARRLGAQRVGGVPVAPGPA